MLCQRHPALARIKHFAEHDFRQKMILGGGVHSGWASLDLC